MPPLRGKGEDVEAKYDVTLNYPNLELHSAAASGNVGLVHYAITHGQPVNSVLHGVLPLHAACSGGSSSVVKMLIERGADVNAPRLPRRYSDGKKSTAPSIGAAGSTPLHFAAANGHASIVQILLTCGAIPDKSDKNGMTPEALAEINGHIDVIRVLRVWEHLQATDPSMSIADTTSCQAPEMDISENPNDEENRFPPFGSRKGKERAFSFASSVSESTTGQAVKLKHSLEGLLLRGRASRSGSVASVKPDLPSAVNIEEEAIVEDDASIKESVLRQHGDHQDSDAPELNRVSSTASGSSQPPPLVRVTSGPLEDGEIIGESPVDPAVADLGPAPSRHNPSTSGSSRRPSLPSIFEKAAHPGAAFRAAMRREHKEHNTKPPPIHARQSPTSPGSGRFFNRPNSPSTDSTPTSAHGHGFFRGRTRHNESPKSKHGKYMSKHALVHLFKRSHSPPSRSPSPPRRDKTTPIDAEQIEEGMEKLRRASLDLDLRTSNSLSEDERAVARLPVSAPATQTTFQADSIIPSLKPLTIDTSVASLSPSQSRDRTVVSVGERRTRSRQASEVIAPSPLANEWATSSDSDTASSVRIRRSKTEVIKSSFQFNPDYNRPVFHAHRSNPPSPLRLPGSTRARAVTSPSISLGSPLRSASGTKLAGMGWDGPVDLRKVASVNQETRSRQEAAEHEGTTSKHGSRTTSQESIPLYEEPSEATDSDQTPQASDAASDIDTTPTKPSETVTGLLAEIIKEEEMTALSPNESTVPLSIEVIEPTPVNISDITQAVRKQGRYRGASIGSMSATTESSRVSTPPASLRMSSLNSDDEPRSPTYPLYTYPDSKTMPPPPPPSSVGGRSRGKSVSSISSNPSEILSYFQASTPGTSLTPQSTLSMGRFPPVPEHEVAHHPAPSRKVSNRAEAREAKRQAEDDVLQLAQLPPSLDSSRSLAAQLAAYGDSHALEQEFADRESARGGRKAKQSEDGDETSGWSGMSESESWFSANSGTDSAGGSGLRSEVSSKRSRRKAVPPTSEIPPQLLPIDAPRSSLSSINTIYDKRAAAYRDRMAALTSIPPAFPSSLTSNRSSTMRQRATSSESWLTAGAQSRPLTFSEVERDKHPNISGPLPLKSSDSIYTPSLSNVKGRNKAPTVGSSIRSVSYKSAQLAPSISPSRAMSHGSGSVKAPAPIADVVSTRYAGMSPPPHVPQPPRLDPTSPYRSIFSNNRYSGQPHDGDDSDDNEAVGQGLTVVENDWRGRVVPDDTFERKGRWGQFKGAIGKVGHRKPT